MDKLTRAKDEEIMAEFMDEEDKQTHNDFIKELYEEYKLPNETLNQFEIRVIAYQKIFIQLGEYSGKLLTTALALELRSHHK